MANREDTCGCCEGTTAITPTATTNRPGLRELSYRVGTHATFLETMKARLSCAGYPALRGLTARDEYDPSLALLDAWATVADVLTFYQERIANEGYLRTASERRSVQELARLIGYGLRPGVAASVWLALELDKDYELKLKPYEIKAQSLPGPGEMPQTFENVEEIEVRHAWNKLRPRLKRPQTIKTIKGDKNLESPGPRIYVKGISTNLKANDVILITESDQPVPDCLYRVVDVKPDAAADRTLVTTETMIASEAEGKKRKRMRSANVAAAMASATVQAAASAEVYGGPKDSLKKVMAILTKQASVPPRSAASLNRDIARIFDAGADVSVQMAGAFQPDFRQALLTTLPNSQVSSDKPVRAYAFRAVARPFGHNAPLKSIIKTTVNKEPSSTSTTTVSYAEWTAGDMEVFGEDGNTLYLDSKNERLLPGSWILVDTRGVAQDGGTRYFPTDERLLVGKVDNPKVCTSRAAYGMAGSSTSVNIIDSSAKESKAWCRTSERKMKRAAGYQDDSFRLIRQTTVYLQSEELVLADEPIFDAISGDCDEIELDYLYSGLQSGRWLVVAGERDDIWDDMNKPITGVKAAELVMLAEVVQKPHHKLPGDQTHTFIKLAKKLEYCYRRDTVTIYGNVVKATHGETRKETLGSGDAATAFQSFALKQPPLTFVSSPVPSGAENTLKVYVNDVQWHETDSHAGREATDRMFVTKIDDDGKTTVVFGSGEQGLRLPTGTENVRALYRNGIGRTGNARAGQISQLLSKPLGVKGVINPIRASGGADRESGDTARSNAPRTVTALDRLVSVQDYADFARTFAGVGKAVAANITDGRRQWVHVTIAGADDIPIDEASDLYSNLLQQMHDCGDPYQPVALQVRELMLLLISARVRIASDRPWEAVAADVRRKLLATFSFEARVLGQSVVLSEVIAAIQSVRGVEYVDVDVLGGVPEKKSEGGGRRLLTPQEIAEEAKKFLKDTAGEQPRGVLPVNLACVEGGAMAPAQLAYLSPEVADTLVLNQMA